MARDPKDDRAFLAGLPDPASLLPPASSPPLAKPTRAPPPPPGEDDGARLLLAELAAGRQAVAALSAKVEAAFPDAKALEARLVQAAMQGGREAARRALDAQEPRLKLAETVIDRVGGLGKAQEAQGRLVRRFVVWGSLIALFAVLVALGGLLKAMAGAGTLAPRVSVFAGYLAGAASVVLVWVWAGEAAALWGRWSAADRWRKAQRR